MDLAKVGGGITGLRERAERLEARLAKLREHGEETTEALVSSMVGGSAAFATGFSRGRFGEITLGGAVPAEVIASAGLHLLAFARVPGKYSAQVHSAADGIASVYLGMLGVNVGRKLAESGEK